MTRILFYFLLLTLVSACGPGGAGALFGKRSPHQQYQEKLERSGLLASAMGNAWLSESRSSLAKPLRVTLPHRESGYFSSQEARATAIQFTARRGEKITVSIVRRPPGFRLYADLWSAEANQEPRLLAFSDTTSGTISFDADDRTEFILRLQPELLSGGEYSLTITSGPLLVYPVANPQTNRIGSFWGDDRDAGARPHEGIDLFSPFRTPVVAAAKGTVTRVGENTLGGKVVFMRPDGKNYTLYYAHLDSQIAVSGQQVLPGDTLGLMGNTGNARTTPPHLHFGIYTASGAINPLPFIDRTSRTPPRITADSSRLGNTLVLTRSSAFLGGTADPAKPGDQLPAQTAFLAESALAGLYRVRLPDGATGYVAAANTRKPAATAKKTLTAATPLFDRPDPAAARKSILEDGSVITVLGRFGAYQLVSAKDTVGWIPANN